MIRCKAAALVQCNMVGGNITVSAEELRVLCDRVVIQQRKHPVPAVAAARGDDAVNALVRKRSVDVCGAHGVRSGKIAVHGTRAFIYNRLKPEPLYRRNALCKPLLRNGARGSNNRNARAFEQLWCVHLILPPLRVRPSALKNGRILRPAALHSPRADRCPHPRRVRCA